MTTWLVVGVVIVVAGLLVARLARSSGTPAWHDAARSGLLGSLLSARGLDGVRIVTKAPPDLPKLRLPIGWGWRSQAGAEGTGDGTRWMIYDTELRGRGVSGCNAKRSSDGESSICRHTVALLQSDRLRLPRVTIVPNVRARLGTAMPDRFREAGLGDSKLANWAAKAAQTMAAIEEHGTAVALPGRPGLRDAFRVTGDDANAVDALLDGDTASLLLRHPWAIVETDGAWLAVSRYTADAYATRREHDDFGWLSSESAAEVLELAHGLAGRWARAAHSPT